MSKWLVEVTLEDDDKPILQECENEAEANRVFNEMAVKYPTATIMKKPNTRKVLVEY